MTQSPTTDDRSQNTSAEAQGQRRHEMHAMVRDRFRPMLNGDGRAPNLLWWDQARVAIWSTHAFFTGDESDIAFANTILRYVRDVLQPKPDAPRPFETSGLAGLLAAHDAKLDEDVRTWADQLLSELLPNGMTRDFQFQGMNDNMPVMFTWALLFGGQRYHNDRCTEVGRANLLQLRDLLRRRGTVSEYGSNYATHRLTGIAHIVEHIDDPELRRIAHDIEHRLWAELAGHYHPRLGTLSGASMRGGSPWKLETPTLLRHVFGDAILPPDKPWTEFLERSPAEHTRELGLDPDTYLFAYPFGYGSEFVSATYHVPDDVAALFYEKPDAFTFECSTEQGYINEGVFCEQEHVYGQGGMRTNVILTDREVVIPHFPDNGAQPHGLVTHHGRNFAIGTSTTNQFATSHAFRCTYARHDPLRHDADRGEVLVRYNLNEKTQGGRTENTYRKTPDRETTQQNYCTLTRDDGRHHTLQHGPTALCLQVPQYLEHWDIRSMRTDVAVFQPGGWAGRAWVGETPVDALPFESDAELVTLDQGAVYLAIRPLIGRHLERRCAIRLHAAEDYLIISLYNYQGEAIELSEREMLKLGNGFLFDVRDAADFDSFDAFREQMRQTQVLDQLYAGTRRVHVHRPGLRMSMEVCPYANTVKSRSINGRTVEYPQLRFSNALEQTLPLLGEAGDPDEDWAWLQTQINRPAETYNVID